VRGLEFQQARAREIRVGIPNEKKKRGCPTEKFTQRRETVCRGRERGELSNREAREGGCRCLTEGKKMNGFKASNWLTRKF